MAPSQQTPSMGKSEQPTFKEQLDQAAHEARHPEAKDEGAQQPSLVEKVTEYVPAAAKILGTGKSDKAEEERSKKKTPPTEVPPTRPHHDEHIEEFVRDQHRSKVPDPEG